MTRIRSPNYPTIGLQVAVEKARAIHKAEGKNAVAREAMAKALGFGGLNGASATMLSALAKYGLLDTARDGEAKLSDLSMRILYPDTPEEKQTALGEAALKPAIFTELQEKWPDQPPSDDSLRSYLTRRGFSEGALNQVIQFYREIIDIAKPGDPVQRAPEPVTPVTNQENVVTPQVHTPEAAIVTPPVAVSAGQKPFTLAFDGSVLSGSLAIKSVRDIERLMKVLQAQKAAFEAMQDDDEGSESDEENI